MCVFWKRLWLLCHGAKNFFGRWHENLFWKSCNEMSLKKVIYNQHVPHMHTPISAFACYDTPLQASYQSNTCKRRTISTKSDKCMVGVWLSCHLPLGSIIIHSGEPPRQSPLCPPLSKLIRKKSHWRTVMYVRFFILTEFYGQTLCVCRACFPTCISQLTSSPWQPAVLSPNSLVLHTLLVNVNRTSELHRSLAGGAGVSSPPIIIRSALDHVYHL